MFELGIISDEIEQDFEQACQLIRDWGMTHVELRTMWGKNILELSETELEQVRQILTRYQLKVTAIASPIFKSSRDGKPKEASGDFQLSGFEAFEGQLTLLRRAANLCHYFKTNKIRIFTFWRESWNDALVQDVAEKLIEATKLAKSLNVTLAVENEPVCVVGTGKELGTLFDVIRSKMPIDLKEHIGILWDPGNASHGGEETPYPNGYDLLHADEIIHIHLKDAFVDEVGNRKLLPLGQGIIDYVAQFQRLKTDAYRGILVLEPHYHPEGMSKIDAAYTCVIAAKECLLESFPTR